MGCVPNDRSLPAGLAAVSADARLLSRVVDALAGSCATPSGGEPQENLLTVFGPLSVILLIVLWAIGLVLSFALVHWGFGSRMTAPGGASGFAIDLYMSGTTFFTLGLGDVTPQTTLGRALTVFEGGMGFGFLALVIGYLPMISEAYSRREVSISMLDARAGSPPSAGQLLRRHYHDPGDDLRALLRDWERWSAELLESHISFPLLSYFRSQHDKQSWVAALTTILDVCALVVARIEDTSRPTARLTFAMARHAVVDLCAIFRPRPGAPTRRPSSDLGTGAARDLSRRGWCADAYGRSVDSDVQYAPGDVRAVRAPALELLEHAAPAVAPAGRRRRRPPHDPLIGFSPRIDACDASLKKGRLCK